MVALGKGAEPALLGQPVCALIAGGGYAEYAVVPAGQCLPVPASLSMVEAAAVPETLFTVWTNLFERGYATKATHGPRRRQAGSARWRSRSPTPSA
ncbi:hypothetical protein AB5I41_23970 [Sphingomonas sp. MMS24-JH45]